MNVLLCSCALSFSVIDYISSERGRVRVYTDLCSSLTCKRLFFNSQLQKVWSSFRNVCSFLVSSTTAFFPGLLRFLNSPASLFYWRISEIVDVTTPNVPALSLSPTMTCFSSIEQRRCFCNVVCVKHDQGSWKWINTIKETSWIKAGSEFLMLLWRNESYWNKQKNKSKTEH